MVPQVVHPLEGGLTLRLADYVDVGGLWMPRPIYIQLNKDTVINQDIQGLPRMSRSSHRAAAISAGRWSECVHAELGYSLDLKTPHVQG
jgi:hypothetical protein